MFRWLGYLAWEPRLKRSGIYAHIRQAQTEALYQKSTSSSWWRSNRGSSNPSSSAAPPTAQYPCTACPWTTHRKKVKKAIAITPRPIFPRRWTTWLAQQVGEAKALVWKRAYHLTCTRWPKSMTQSLCSRLPSKTTAAARTHSRNGFLTLTWLSIRRRGLLSAVGGKRDRGSITWSSTQASPRVQQTTTCSWSISHRRPSRRTMKAGWYQQVAPNPASSASTQSARWARNS